jgi:pyruvate/2-oxoglutarate dehydrogenase complex dihydrolipoamide dehydrogenase (E3) component
LGGERRLEIGERGGIRVDDQMRTGDPNIFAIGDHAPFCSRQADNRFGSRIAKIAASLAQAH